MSAQAHRRKAGSTEFQGFDVPALAVRGQVASHLTQGISAKRHILDAQSHTARDRRFQGASEQLGDLLHRGRRRCSRRFRDIQQRIEVELPSGHDRVVLRSFAELEVHNTAQP